MLLVLTANHENGRDRDLGGHHSQCKILNQKREKRSDDTHLLGGYIVIVGNLATLSNAVTTMCFCSQKITPQIRWYVEQ
jgi:hypothetical protein